MLGKILDLILSMTQLEIDARSGDVMIHSNGRILDIQDNAEQVELLLSLYKDQNKGNMEELIHTYFFNDDDKELNDE